MPNIITHQNRRRGKCWKLFRATILRSVQLKKAYNIFKLILFRFHVHSRIHLLILWPYSHYRRKQSLVQTNNKATNVKRVSRTHLGNNASLSWKISSIHKTGHTQHFTESMLNHANILESSILREGYNAFEYSGVGNTLRNFIAKNSWRLITVEYISPRPKYSFLHPSL